MSCAESSPDDPLERLFALSPEEQRVFILEAPPQPSETARVSAAGDTPVDATPEKTGGEGVLEVLAEGTPDLLEFVFSEVFGSLLEWLE